MDNHEDERSGVVFFVFYWLMFSLGSIFISNGFKFAVYDLSGSERLVSLVGSVSGVAFITLGLFSGIVVAATSNRFFILFHLYIFSLLSLLIYFLFRLHFLNVTLLFGLILLQGMTSSLHSAAANRVFYDLAGTKRLSFWLSRRNIAVSAGSFTALVILSFYVDKSAELFLIYAAILLCSAILFIATHYQDAPRESHFNSSRDAVRYIRQQFIAFLSFSYANATVRMLFILSFAKTFFIYWAMSAGILLKLGIDSDDSRRLYLYILIGMDVVSMVVLYLIGKKRHFDNRDFLFGAAVSALGILLFALIEYRWLAIVTLTLMHIGFAICQMASGYVLRHALPEHFRTQGISFAVIPYYFADIVSGFFFAGLQGWFTTTQLLILSGGGLLLLCLTIWPFVKRETMNT